MTILPTLHRAVWAGAALLALAPVLGLRDADAADPEAGKALYAANCVSCHGPAGQGDGPVGAALTPPPRDFSEGAFRFDADGDGTPGGDADLALVIRDGAAAYGGSPLMAPWPTLSDAQVRDLVAYVRSLQQPGPR